MTNRSFALLACCALALVPVHASAGDDVAARHAVWRTCLHRNFALQAVLTSRVVAADASLRTCRAQEERYLTALSASPLVDGDDVARVRPALLERAKGWLLTGAATRPL